MADGVVTVHSACAEVGQGFVTLAQQIAREVLGLDEVELLRQLTEQVRFVYLKRQVPDEVAEAVRALDIPGVLMFNC